MNTRSDADIWANVEAELRCCPDVDETDVVVKVRDGIVTLTGFARSFCDKYGAEDAIKRVRGVNAVANDLVVQTRDDRTSICDPQIARAAVAAIQRQLPLCCEQLRPLVQQGCVTLEGRVEWIYQREEAEAAVRRLPGVRGVINAIALAPCVAPAAAAIEEAIRKTLARHAGPDGCGLTVDVVGGEVTLRGWVGSRDERSVAEQCARATYGVQTVRNELSIRSEGAAAKNYA